MSLAAIGPYQVIRELGRGAMGVVYLAADTRLNRHVAIKALPEELTSDPERLARLKREARALASLNHPNVGSIHGLEEVGERRYLVLEYIEGQTLAQRLARGAPSIQEALLLGKQIAEGLEAAHEKGIVHRDLKPGNIMVTAAGAVKVLDFGLARFDEQAGAAALAGASEVATATHQAQTVEGMLMGTPGYMSPEQARGEVVDKRSDIFAFGCVLYECLTGSRLYAGRSHAEKMARLLGSEPSFTALPPRTPGRIRELLARTLEKDLRRRLHDIGDARLDLEQALAEREWSSSDTGRTARGPIAWNRLLAASAAIAAACAAAAYTGWHLGGRGAPSHLTSIARWFTKLTDRVGVERQPSLSPDGKTIVYVALEADNNDIHSLRVGGLNPVNLTRGCLQGDSQPAFSPDGTRIAFRSERDGGGLFQMGATGESPRRITDFGFNPSWTPDGRSIVFATEGVDSPYSRRMVSAIWLSDVSTGEKRKILDGDAVQPSVSPNNLRIAYWGRWIQGGQRDISTVALEGGTPVPLTNDPATDWCPVWSPDGRHIYFCSDRSGSMDLWRVAVDERTGQRQGEFEPVTAGTTPCRNLSISADGKRIVVESQYGSSNLVSIQFDPAAGVPRGERTTVTQYTGSVSAGDASPDGEWIVCYTSGVQEDIVLIRRDGAERRQLTNDRAKDRGPKWSPDGRRIAFYSDRSGQYEVWMIAPDGSGLTQVTHASEANAQEPVWRRDGQRLLYTTKTSGFLIDPNRAWDDQTPERIENNDKDGRLFVGRDWSPDGACIVGELVGGGVSANSTTGRSLALYRPETKAMDALEIDGENPRFLPGSGGLIFEQLGVTWLCDPDGNNLRRLFPAGDDPGSFSFLSSDASTVFFQSSRDESDIWMIEVD